MKKFFSNIVGVLEGLWIIVGFPAHIIAVSVLAKSKFAKWYVSLILVAVWWGVTLTVMGIEAIIKKRTNAKFEADMEEYRRKYVAPMPIIDEVLGELPFEKDSNHKTIRLHVPKMKIFDGKEVDVSLEIEEPALDAAIEALRYVHNFQERIIKRAYDFTLESCEVYDEIDENCRPAGMDFVKENLDFSILLVENFDKRIVVTLNAELTYGYEKLLDSHTVVVELDYPDKTIECRLEG